MPSLEEDEHLGGQECWDFGVPIEKLIQCDSYPWWEEAAWLCGAKVEQSVLVRSADSTNDHTDATQHCSILHTVIVY